MDLEARAHSEHPEALRLWLRLLTCTQLIEKQVRGALRERFDTTLPRFDLMSQLERAPEGMKMSELSRRMMVTGGNVTGITDQLVTEGLVERVDVEGDRRAWRVRLTVRGRKAFQEMAQQHEGWIVDAFAALSEREIAQLHKLLGKVKADVQSRQQPASTPGQQATPETA
ncbi:MarR family transcriptional regulator [Xenophilus aerolatus]|jgi:DNA-binding MarR family transcriptional regulator|nr:MarR family transcriptional regulator [Xenophilus aerolatus]